MVTRKTNKAEFVEALHNFIMSHNQDLGMRHGLTEDQVSTIMENQKKDNEKLCQHVYDFLLLEGYIDA